MITAETIAQVQSETERADRIHGPIPSDPVRAMVVLMEEVGEASNEILSSTRGPNSKADSEYYAIDEMIQVASVALRIIDKMKERVSCQTKSQS